MMQVSNLSRSPVKKFFLKKISQKVLKGEKKKGLDLSVALVGQTEIKELNKKYRKKNKPTDVLSFNYEDSGEIVICPAEVRKNAKKYGSPFKKELARVLIHGILHILGYEHEKEKPAQSRALRRARQNTKFLAGKMLEKEDYYLKIIYVEK